MTDQPDGAHVRTQVTDAASVGARLDDERRKAGLLGDVREAIFGAQDGLVSTLAVVSTVSGATNDRFPVLIAGIAAGLAGIFSMAAGEYLSSKSQPISRACGVRSWGRCATSRRACGSSGPTPRGRASARRSAPRQCHSVLPRAGSARSMRSTPCTP